MGKLQQGRLNVDHEATLMTATRFSVPIPKALPTSLVGSYKRVHDFVLYRSNLNINSCFECTFLRENNSGDAMVLSTKTPSTFDVLPNRLYCCPNMSKQIGRAIRDVYHHKMCKVDGVEWVKPIKVCVEGTMSFERLHQRQRNELPPSQRVQKYQIVPQRESYGAHLPTPM